MKRPSVCACGSHIFEPSSDGLLCVDCWREYAIPHGSHVIKADSGFPVVKVYGFGQDAPKLKETPRQAAEPQQGSFLDLLSSAMSATGQDPARSAVLTAREAR